MSKLMEAIKHGDLLTIANLVTPYNINEYSLDDYSTPLICAIRHNQIEAVKLLITLGANVRPPGVYYDNPVTHAIHNNNFAMAELLLSKGADVNKGFYRPLNQAVDDNNLNTATFLMQHGADLNAGLGEYLGDTAIMRASELGNAQMVRWLIDHGAVSDSYLRDPQWDPYNRASATSALFNAVKHGHKEVIQILLDDGAGQSEGITPLHVAVLRNDISAMQSLLAEGLAPDLLNDIGQTAFHYALHLNNIEALAILKTYGADINLEVASDYGNISPMEMAVNSNATEACLWLIENGIDLHQKYEYGDTLLSMAAFHGNLTLVTELLKMGANIHDRDDSGESVLHSAALNDSPEMIKLLVDHGAQLNIQNDKGRTELFTATNSLRFNENDNAVVKLLLELGSDPSIQDNQGNTALDYFKMVNRNTGHLVPNYDSICKLLTQQDKSISESDVIKASDSLDSLFSDAPSHVENNLHPPAVEQPILAEAHLPQPSLFSQIYSWVIPETTPAVH